MREAAVGMSSRWDEITPALVVERLYLDLAKGVRRWSRWCFKAVAVSGGRRNAQRPRLPRATSSADARSMTLPARSDRTFARAGAAADDNKEDQSSSNRFHTLVVGSGQAYIRSGPPAALGRSNSAERPRRDSNTRHTV